MTVAGDSRDRALELARRMEESQRFSQTQVVDAHSEQSTTGDTERVQIVAIYIPEPLAVEGPSATKIAPKMQMKTMEMKMKTVGKPKTAAPKGSQP